MTSCVTYWPSTEPSIKKQVHPVEDITLTCGRVEFDADATPTRSSWVSNNYITGCHRRFELFGVSCSWSSSCSSRQWEPAPDSELAALSDPQLSIPAEWERSAAIVRKTWGQYVAVCPRPQITSHTQPFRNPFKNKVWEVYFSKEVCSFVIIVDFVSACICIRIVVSWLNNTWPQGTVPAPGLCQHAGLSSLLGA